jgi:hypothetical protein
MRDLEQLAFEVFGKLSLRNLTPSIATYNFKLCNPTCGLYMPAERSLDLYFTHSHMPRVSELAKIFGAFDQIRSVYARDLTIHYQSALEGSVFNEGTLRLPAIH